MGRFANQSGAICHDRLDQCGARAFCRHALFALLFGIVEPCGGAEFVQRLWRCLEHKRVTCLQDGIPLSAIASLAIPYQSKNRNICVVCCRNQRGQPFADMLGSFGHR